MQPFHSGEQTEPRNPDRVAEFGVWRALAFIRNADFTNAENERTGLVLRRSMSRSRRPEKSYTVSVVLMTLAGVGGLLALAMGAMALFDAAEDRARHAFVSRLPDLLSAPQGETGILEGRIAASAPPLREEFVAYLREERSGLRRSDTGWVSLGGKVQPLTIETGAGAVRVVNTDYTFDRAIREWTPSSREESPPTAMSGSIRIEGLVAGGSVMIVGRAGPSGAPDEIIAESIAGVDRKTYLDRLWQGQTRAQPFALGMLMLGPAGIAYAVWAGRRILRDR